MSHLYNYSVTPPPLPGSTIPTHDLNFERASTPTSPDAISPARMLEHVIAQEKPSHIVSIAKFAYNTCAYSVVTSVSFGKKIIYRLFGVKTSTAPVSTEREVHGQRIYHYKKDLEPWFDNMINAGKQAVEKIHKDFEKLVSKKIRSMHEDLIPVANIEKEKALEKLDHIQRALKKGHFSEEMDAVLVAEGDAMKIYKKFSQQIEKGIHKIIKNYGKAIKDETLGTDKIKGFIVTDNTRKHIEKFSQEVEETAADREGIERFNLYHKDPLWDPSKPTNRVMGFTYIEKTYDEEEKKWVEVSKDVKAVSSFLALGPAFSSQAPRNREANEVVAPNFFRSTFKLPNIRTNEEETVLDVTRSAITVEFDLEDPIKRTKANRILLKQTIDAGVLHWMDKLPASELESHGTNDNPIVFKRTTVNFLTPDILRSWSAKYPIFRKIISKIPYIGHALTGAPADNERSLALQSLATHRDMDGTVHPYKYKDAEGNEKTVYVKYDLHYFNIPNNKHYDLLPKVMTDVEELTHSNNTSWVDIEKDVLAKINDIDQKLHDKAAALELSSHKIGHHLEESLQLRTEIMKKTIKEGKMDTVAFLAWQKQADELGSKIERMKQDPDTDHEELDYLNLITEKMDLSDLYLDTKELFESGLSKNLKNMDNNRFAMSTRLILLVDKAGEGQVHFGCRSGKDRTGLVDVELKLLLTEARLKGRIPSYREQEKIADNMNHREIITKESGNVFDIVKANLGAYLGLMSFGAASKAPNLKTKKQFMEITKSSQGFAKIAHRPNTKSVVPAGQMDKWERDDQGVYRLKASTWVSAA